MKTKLNIAIFLAPIFWVSSVWAGTELSNGDEVVGSTVKAVLDLALKMVTASPFAETGAYLFKVLLLILIAWKGIKLMLDTTAVNQVIAELVNIILIAGIASMFLTPDIQNKLASGFDILASTAANASGTAIVDMSNPTAAITNVMGATIEAASKLWEGPVKPEASEQKGVLDGFFSAGYWGDILGALASLGYRVLIALLIVASGLIYLGNLVMSQITVNIALIVAPIFVPWILWDATSFLFHGWLKFMIVAGIQKVVGALLFGMTAAMIPAVTKIASDAGATGSVNFYAYSAAFILIGLMAQLMVQVNGIASGLVSGMGKTGFAAPAAMSPGGMASRGASAMSSAGGGAARGASRGAQAAFGGVKGAVQGSKGSSSVDSMGMKSTTGGGAAGAFKGMKEGIKGGWSGSAKSGGAGGGSSGGFAGFSKK